MATTVAALDGQALRALAWTELAAAADTAEAALTLAGRVVAHLDIVIGSLESLADPPA
jgi:hypothetical protein